MVKVTYKDNTSNVYKANNWESIYNNFVDILDGAAKVASIETTNIFKIELVE